MLGDGRGSLMASLIRGQREGPPTMAVPRLKSVCGSRPSLVCDRLLVIVREHGFVASLEAWGQGQYLLLQALGGSATPDQGSGAMCPTQGSCGPVGPPTSSLLHPLLNINFAAFRSSPPTHTPGKKSKLWTRSSPSSHLSSFWSSNFLPSCQIFIAL